MHSSLSVVKIHSQCKMKNMKTNEILQKDVQDAIKWEPLLNAAEIGVTAKDGIITLTGTVDSYAKKLEAEDAAKNVIGVKAVVEKIKIVFSGTWQKSDAEVAKEVLLALKSSWKIPNDKVIVKVEDGWVTLEGELSWNYQRVAAKESVANLLGVKGVTNNIAIKSDKDNKIEKNEIERALARNWSINAKDIHVKVTGSRVILTGMVNSMFQKDEAARIVWNAPGVWNLDNELVVEYDHVFAD